MIALDKPVGPTALQALVALRASDPALADVKLGHAGRLDPMAEGLLTVLVGEENRRVNELRALAKVYEVDVLLGIGSDSFDDLGLVSVPTATVLDRECIATACEAFVGTRIQRYPPFSQARVDGRSLIAWNHAGIVVERPGAERTMSEVVLLAVRTTDVRSMAARALGRIALVRGNFRQGAITARWNAVAAAHGDTAVTVATVRIACSAGTYMRAFADDLGTVLGVPALASRIRRTHAGDLTLDGARSI